MSTSRMFFLIPFLATLLVACNTEQQSGRETAVSGSTEVLVDGAIVSLIAPAKELFDKENPRASIALREVSANDAVTQLLRHETRGIIIARDWLPDEAEAVRAEKGADGYPRSLLAKDALVFFVAKSFPYDTMHANHIREWFATGRFPRTSYVKLTKVPLAVVPGSYSSAYGNVVNVVLGGKVPYSGVLTSKGTRDSVVAYVKSTPNAIGIGLLSQLVADTTVKMLRLSWTDSTGAYEHPRPVHQGYLVQGLYPFPVPVWFVLRDRANNYNLASSLMLFMARDGKAQRTFLDAGIEPAFAKIELNILE